jgi:3-oxoacyl-[acyl-carrier protein] reductase
MRGRVAVVTGSSRGIGAAIATLFAAEGAHVAVHGRDASAVEAVRARIEADGGTASAVIADLMRFDQIEAVRKQVENQLGPVDVLVANAGGTPVRPGPVEDMSEEDWRASVDANRTVTFLTIKSFLPGMKQRGRGTIITMSSAAARRPNAHSPIAYAAAKAGIELLSPDPSAT